MQNKLAMVAALSVIGQCSLAATPSINATPKDVTELDMADLLKVQVTSVSKKAQALSDAPAAIFAISHEDIKRSGVTSIPEALRLAPGLDVARINSNKWAITSRGFNGSSANKLLVLIDGRSVYTPGFSGVYWDAQDILLEDVDRIEVIRGPGATLWGANAVNGVINIITKKAEATQGGLITGGGGTRETGFGALRYGKKFGEDTYGRAYVKGFKRDNFKTLQGTDNGGDAWEKQQGGFRIDSRLSSKDELTLQGDLYRTNFNQAVTEPTFNPPIFQRNINDNASNEGWNLTSRLRHAFSTTAEYTLQVYYDHTKRNEFLIDQSLDTFDVDFQNNFELTERQNAIWGLGYRVNLDNFTGTPIIQLNPSSRNTQLFNAFVQDEITLIDNTLWLTLGSKFEHNDYTGFEGQPTARLMWAPDPKQRFWASFSRAVRTPARAENDIQLRQGVLQPREAPFPMAIMLNGNRQYQSEVQLSYELGYRFTLSQKASLDITAFYNDYDKLRSAPPPGTVSFSNDPPFPINNLFFSNTNRANTWGVEAATVWQMTDWWRWDTNYSYLGTHINDPDSSISPQHKLSLRAVINPIDSVNFDLWLRYNSTAITANSPPSRFLKDDRSTSTINGYVTLDARLAWKPYSFVELSLIGQNLLADNHLEYLDEGFFVPTTVPRAVYGKVTLEF